MRIQTSASVFGASDAVFMGSILPLNGVPLQENDAIAPAHARLAQRWFRACRSPTRSQNAVLLAEQRDHLLLVLGRAVGKAHAHAAQADGRHFEVALAEFALLHCFL